MDTPERSKVAGTPISKFEGGFVGLCSFFCARLWVPIGSVCFSLGLGFSKGKDSPVFNFINNLSPIQPVEPQDSLHVTQTYQSLNFASLSSIFSSPHINPPRETRSSGRVPLTNSIKEDNASNNADESNLLLEVSDVARPSRFTTSAQENCMIACSLNEATVDPPDQCPNLPSTFPQPTQYESGSPDHNLTPCYGIKMDDKLYVDNTSVELHLIQTSVEQRKILFAMGNDVQETHSFDLTKDEAFGCDWESLISDDGEGLLIFDSSMELEAQMGEAEKSMDDDGNIFASLLTNFTENADCLQKIQPDISHGSCVHNVSNDPSSSCTEGCNMDHETDCAKKVLSDTCQDQVDIHQQRGMLRRCLVFELASVSKKNLTPSTSSSKGKRICGANNLKLKTTPLRALPGIGLHLNALATTSKDTMVTKDAPTSGKQVISIPIDPLISETTERENPTNSLSVGKDSGPEDSEGHLQIVPYDDPKDAIINNCEELTQGSPKKKRRKTQSGGDSEGCKRCNCKKSKCLKLYCECFAAGVYCSEPCSCQECVNKPVHEETVLATRKQIESRNPLAFAPKVIRTSESGLEVGDDDNRTPASARHKRGCNCKKSNCLKKYCECYQVLVELGVQLGADAKDARIYLEERMVSTLPSAEGIDQAEKEADAYIKEDDKLEDGQQSTSIQIEHHAPGNILPATPLRSIRLPVEMPFYSSSKPPQPTRLLIGRSPALYGSHMIRKPEFVHLQTKLDNVTTILEDDDTPAILRSTATSTTGIKVSSPNGKRVSPPHTGVGLTPPNRKGCRKLILKSIPSFPSLSTDDAEH
ncbi:hypothetical protein ZIOFF_016809 [Zingiber officinale]|uniref:CRC domain-containing protein n=1 Tax=Zingiber officinale TaxID=94328 RepID=A0A8J5HG24_ZINOF|nr:hypothetical protein ZIOFF_016809 [Zingiber officinale]